MSKRLLLVLIFGFSIVGMGIAIGVLQPSYQRWTLARATADAFAYLAQTNYAKASLSARRALQINSNCVTACRVMAQIEAAGSSLRALDWCQRVLQIEPNSFSNQLVLARMALQFQRREVARQTLAQTPVPCRSTNSDYHALCAQIAFADHDLATAEEHLGHAVQLDPTNRVHSCNLQIIRLHSPNPNVVRAAREQLEPLRTDPVHGTAVCRALILEAISRGDLRLAWNGSQEIQARPDFTFDDRLLDLSIAHALLTPSTDAPAQVPTDAPSPGRTDAPFPALLTRSEVEAGTNPDRISALAIWLIDHRLAALALPWLESFPDDVRAATPVRAAEVECYVSRQDWQAVVNLLRGSQWGGDDHLRHALLALAYRRLQEENLAQNEWKRAVRAANTAAYAGPRPQVALVRLAGAWAWEREAEEFLWDLAGQGPENRWALALLRQAYEMGRDTRALVRVFAAMLKWDPSDPVTQNNLAAASLLVGTNLSTAYQLARDAFAVQPTNAEVACTYAYSMHLQGRTAEGVELLSKFDRELAEHPVVAGYYGLLLSADGARDKAQKYLNLARQAHLLPEEKLLIDKAQSGKR